jgi:hypothetical protein
MMEEILVANLKNNSKERKTKIRRRRKILNLHRIPPTLKMGKQRMRR